MLWIVMIAAESRSCPTATAILARIPLPICA
jgi:hypothetical protein